MAGETVPPILPARRASAIQNPLAMVGIFAGFAETCATVVIFRLQPEQAKVFIWFVMGFPVLIVLLFFAILYVRPVVFYNPADVGMEIFVKHIEKMSFRDPSTPSQPIGTGRKTSRKVKEDI